MSSLGHILAVVLVVVPRAHTSYLVVHLLLVVPPRGVFHTPAWWAHACNRALSVVDARTEPSELKIQLGDWEHFTLCTPAEISAAQALLGGIWAHLRLISIVKKNDAQSRRTKTVAFKVLSIFDQKKKMGRKKKDAPPTDSMLPSLCTPENRISAGTTQQGRRLTVIIYVHWLAAGNKRTSLEQIKKDGLAGWFAGSAWWDYIGKYRAEQADEADDQPVTLAQLYVLLRFGDFMDQRAVAKLRSFTGKISSLAKKAVNDAEFQTFMLSFQRVHQAELFRNGTEQKGTRQPDFGRSLQCCPFLGTTRCGPALGYSICPEGVGLAVAAGCGEHLTISRVWYTSSLEGFKAPQVVSETLLRTFSEHQRRGDGQVRTGICLEELLRIASETTLTTDEVGESSPAIAEPRNGTGTGPGQGAGGE